MKSNRQATHYFKPTEVIFATTDECNLHCQHCFVSRNNNKLSIKQAENFLQVAVEQSEGQLERVGFSGGEPFLYPEFLQSIIKKTVSLDLLFDRIMTNGDFWKNEDELRESLQNVYNAGFDGKFGVSFDSFHAQKPARIATFLQTVFDIWHDGGIIEIQSVVKRSNEKQRKDDNFTEMLTELSLLLKASITSSVNENTGCGLITLEGNDFVIPIQRTPKSLEVKEVDAWESKKWFNDDFCEGPGNILYIHASGKIAPCCGFANEHEQLIIGEITQTWNDIIENASKNQMVKLCYTTGLAKYRKKLEERGSIFPGVTDDICMFCNYICNLKTTTNAGQLGLQDH